MAGSIVLLARDGASTRIVHHALIQRFPELHTILEDAPSRVDMLKRRAKKLGYVTVAGQTDPDGRFLPAPVVEQKPVAGPQRIWVQAGAFSVYDNANKLRARLNSISPATISSAMVSGTQFFRVRLGPLETVDRADQVLAQVLATGQNQAVRIGDRIEISGQGTLSEY